MRRALAALLLATACNDDAAARRYAEAFCRDVCGADPSNPRCRQCTDAGATAGGGASGGNTAGGGTGSAGGGAAGGGAAPFEQLLFSKPDGGQVSSRVCERVRLTPRHFDGGVAALPAPLGVSYRFDYPVSVFTDLLCNDDAMGSLVVGDAGIDVSVFTGAVGAIPVLFTSGLTVAAATLEAVVKMRASLIPTASCYELKVQALYPDDTKVQDSAFTSNGGQFTAINESDGGSPLINGGGCGGGPIGSGLLRFMPLRYSLEPDPKSVRLSGVGLRPLQIWVGSAGPQDAGLDCVNGADCKSLQCASGRCECMLTGGSCLTGACCNGCSGGHCL